MPAKSPTLSFYIPGAPTDPFLSQIAMFRLALNDLGGIYQTAKIIAFLGDLHQRPIPERWLPYLDNVKILRATAEAFHRHGYMAQGDMRWQIEPETDYVVLSDADTIIMKPFADVFQQLDTEPAVGGVIAYSALPVPRWVNPENVWQRMAKEVLNKPIDLAYRLSDRRFFLRNSRTKTPFYVNFGFVIMPKDYYGLIAQSYFDLRNQIIKYIRKSEFSAQAALTLSIEAHGLNKLALPVKYNYANSKALDKQYSDQISDIRVLHYLDKSKFDRHKIFTSASEFNHFLELRLQGSNAIFQQRVLQLTGGNYPFV